MKTRPLNLLLVDENKLLTDPLRKYLNDRFGIRINVSSFFDVESCILKIDEHSHVIILDYFLDSNGQKIKNGTEIFNSIKSRSPKTEVTMITSNEDAAMATEEMQRGASDYIIKQERDLRKIWPLLNQIALSPVFSMVISPIKVRIIMPIRKIIAEYTLRDYLTMFVVAFVAVGSLVFFALKIFR